MDVPESCNGNNNGSSNNNINCKINDRNPCSSSTRRISRHSLGDSDCSKINEDSGIYKLGCYVSSARHSPTIQPSAAYVAAYIAATATNQNDAHAVPTSSRPSISSAAAADRVRLNSQKVTLKRRHSVSDDDVKDPELGCEGPSAKRRQQVVQCPSSSSLYQNDADSVVSSVYPSPVDELVNEIDTRSSSDYCISERSVDIYAALSGAHTSESDNIPDSPNSLAGLRDDEVIRFKQLETVGEDEEEDEDEDDEEDEDDDDDIVSGTTSPSALSSASEVSSSNDLGVTGTAEPSMHTYPTDKCGHLRLPHHGERTPSQRCRPEDDLVESTDDRQRRVKSFDAIASEHLYDCLTPAADPEPVRLCPLPALSWANAFDVWQLMCKKDKQAAELRSSEMLKQHPSLQARMRAILLDWLIEVCEVYKLHRETYYLALDYLDRYLSSQLRVQKTHLQLIGITCLFVAAKVEEIYPPKIGEFAYVTDGACQESDILQHEILLLQALEWNISPVTPMGWLGVYMQLNSSNRTPETFNGGRRSGGCEPDEAFIYPQFSGMEFVQTAQLLDLCSLDLGVSNYPYSVLAAAAISHTFSRETALRCSGLDWLAIQSCARWMEPFFDIICTESEHLQLLEANEQVASKFGLGHICPNIVTDDSHIIQTHNITMSMFDRACLRQEQYRAALKMKKQEASPATGLACPPGLLTPPASSRKPSPTLTANTPLSMASVQSGHRDTGAKAYKDNCTAIRMEAAATKGHV